MWHRRPSPLIVLGLVLLGAVLGGTVACTAPSAGRPPTPGPAGSSTAVQPSSPAPASPTSPPTPPPTPSPTTATDPCAAVVARLSVRQQVGQLFMVGIASSGLSETDAEALAESRAGSVILLGNTSAGRDAILRVTERAREAADAPAGIGTLLAADQEGGQVQRLRGPGFRRIPSAYEQAELSDAELTSRAGRWGRELKGAGIDADLAPVADVVPDELRRINAPIGLLDRGYGSDPDLVAEKVAAFVQGMDASGVATAVKHFPGLGRVRGNTDFEAGVVDRRTRQGDDSWAGFAAGIRAGADMVMVSSATYPRIDPEDRAAFSAPVMQILRRDLGFAGVVISDDLAARALEDVRPRVRALRFLRAGGDLAIVGDSSLVSAMADTVVDEADDDSEFAAQVREKAQRVVAMKARRGLADC
jgi:beta-N-acetylhexosaminidase